MLKELGEIIHGSEEEREAISVLREKFGGFETKLHTVATKEWVIRHQRVLINGKEVGRFAVLPYTKGSAKGKVGRELLALPFPDSTTTTSCRSTTPMPTYLTGGTASSRRALKRG